MSEIKTLNFFGENGITSTSANHIANLAKESVRNVHEKIAATRFYSEAVNLLAGGDQVTISRGMGTDAVIELPKLINQIADANSLIAYLREAIKEKERKMREADEYLNNEGRRALEDDLRNHDAARPTKGAYPTEEQIKQTWSVGEQERYLSLEAEASALGKFIHEDGYMSRARIDLMNKINNPCKVDFNGKDTMIHSFIPTVSVSTVDEVFNSLQDRYRTVQAELNGMKKRIQDTIDTEKLRIDQEYAKAKREWEAQRRELERWRDRIADDEEIHRKELLKEVQSLKIVIPKRLRGIYDMLTNQ